MSVTSPTLIFLPVATPPVVPVPADVPPPPLELLLLLPPAPAAACDDHRECDDQERRPNPRHPSLLVHPSSSASR
jgi:hypothetical protein